MITFTHYQNPIKPMETPTIYKAHIITPKLNLIDMNLEYRDLLTYITIRSFLNSKTKECYPSQRTIAKTSGLSLNFIVDSITRLKAAGLITVQTGNERVSSRYSFSAVTEFTGIPTTILSENSLTPTEKAILVSIRRYFWDSKLETTELMGSIAKYIGVSYSTLYKHYKALEEKGYIVAHVMRNFHGNTDFVTSLTDKFDWRITKLEEKVEAHATEIEILKLKVEELTKLVMKAA